MKKGDQIKQTESLLAGTEVAHNFSSLVGAERWMKTINMPTKAKESSEFPGTYHVVLKENYDLITRAKVNWVVGDEMGITMLNTGMCRVLEVGDWEVEIPGTPSYQSTVENMSEQQLRDSLEVLRSQRRTAPKVKIRTEAVSPRRIKQDPIMKVLEGMDPVKKAELMKKLGMV